MENEATEAPPEDSETYEEDAPFERRLRAWLLRQPEYLVILSLPRPMRRSGLRRVATIILGFPEADVRPGMNRVEKRAALVALKKKLSTQLDKAQGRRSRDERRQDAAGRRIARLSDKRRQFIFQRELDQRMAQELLQEEPLEMNLLTDEHRTEIAEVLSRAEDDGYDLGGEG